MLSIYTKKPIPLNISLLIVMSNLAQVEGFEPPTTVLETVMIPFHHTYVFVIPEGLEPPHLLVRSEMFYPIKLRNQIVELLPLSFSVVLPSSILTYFENWNCFVGIFVTSSPIRIKVVPFIPIKRVPFV